MSVIDTQHDARAIANEILLYARQKGFSLTIMQLLKLVYLVQGWSLALLGRRVIAQDVQAWQYGPVYPQVYKSFVGSGSAPINTLAVDKATGLEYRAALSSRERNILQSVVDSYGGMHAFQLSNIMHMPGTPWSVTNEQSGPYSVIPEDIIRGHFEKLRQDRGVQAE